MNLLCSLGRHDWELKEASVVTFTTETMSSSLDWHACKRKRCDKNKLAWAKHDHQKRGKG